MSIVQPDERELSRPFYALLLTILVSVGLILGLTLFRFQGEAQSRSRVEEFHLGTLSIANEVASRVGIALRVLPEQVPGTESANIEVSPELASAALAIDERAGALVLLQEELGDERFDPAVRGVMTRASLIRQRADDALWTRQQWQDQLASMDFDMFQLGRLHSISAETELRDVARRNDLVRSTAFVLAPLILLVSGFLIVRLVRVVRMRLRQLDASRRELAETQQQLEQSQKMEALGTLAGGIAHDFNNLLTVILGYAEVTQLRIGPEDPAFEPLQTIQSAGEQAANLTRQLLAFSRHESERAEMIDLNLLVRDIEPVLRGLIRGDIELDTQYASNLGAVLVDPAQIEQVLMNLVVNARDSMASGGSLRIRTDDVVIDEVQHDIDAGPYVRLRVQDTGIGMSAEILDRVFDPFFTTKPPGQGTGLGLSTVHGIVSKSGGCVKIESRPGVGTVFDVLLPQAASTELDQVAAPGPANNTGSERILVVEDEDQIRELLARALSERGYDVVATADAEQALAACREDPTPFELVLTDVVMPGLRGPELVALLREIHPRIAVIYVSGYSTDAVLAKVRASGEPFISKPFKLRDMVRAVRESLDQTSRGSTVPKPGPSMRV